MPRTTLSPQHKALCRYLVETRHRAGLTQAALGKLMGRPQSYIGKLELGDLRLEMLSFLDLAVALNVTPAEMATGIAKAVENSRRRKKSESD